MPIKIGEVEALFRYPVKSMRGEPLDAADLGWHGLEGDRRLALRRVDDRSGFPWLTASRLPELILFTPQRREPVGGSALPTHVRTPEGEELAAFVRSIPFEEDAWVGGVLSFGENHEAVSASRIWTNAARW